MKWKKLGQVFCPDNQFPWMKTHAANPIAEALGDGLFRVYFTSRDEKNRSSIGSLEFDIRDPLKIKNISDKPLVAPGELGLFDDSGAAAALADHRGWKKISLLFGLEPGRDCSLAQHHRFSHLRIGPIHFYEIFQSASPRPKRH